MPRFDRTYSLIVGPPTKVSAEYTRVRAETVALSNEVKGINVDALTPDQANALTARVKAQTEKLRMAGSQLDQGIEITNLRINYDISKNSSKNPNRSRIRIYNLSPDHRKLLEKPDVRCIFKAGYAEEDGPLEVYQGDVALAFSTYDRADVITEIQLGEGFKAIRDTMISLSYKEGVNSKKVLEDIAAKMKLSLSMPNDVPTRTWQNGLAFHGAGRQGLDKITAATGLSWSIQGGALQVIRSGGNTNRTVFDLAADSGLIGSPERTRQGKQEVAIDPEDKDAAKLLKARSRQITATQEEDGWRVRSLLLPTLLPADRVKLSSRTVEGVFTIKDLRHFGDTHQGDWITELKLIDPKPAATDTRAQAPAGKTQVRQSNVGGTPKTDASGSDIKSQETRNQLDLLKTLAQVG